MAFDFEDDHTSSTFIFQKWVLNVRILLRSDIALRSKHIGSKYIILFVWFANHMVSSYCANKKLLQRCHRDNQA